MTTPFLTTAEGREFVNMTGTGEDTLIDSLILTASQQLEKFCRREFTSAVYTEYLPTAKNVEKSFDFEGTGSSGYQYKIRPFFLHLNSRPVSESAEFTLNYDPGFSWESLTEISSTSYSVEYAKGIVSCRFGVGSYQRALKAVYTGGYAEDGGTLSASAPEDLKMAVGWQLIHLWDKRKEIGYVGKQGTVVAGSKAILKYSRAGILCPEFMEAAGFYQKPLVTMG